MFILPNDLWEDVHIIHGNHHIFAACKRLAETRPQWLFEEDVCKAAKNGHLKLLQWFRAKGCSWNSMTRAFAALGGHLKVLQWLRADECPWDEDTCAYAALSGHLKVLQWALANGCPWDERLRSYAERHEHFKVIL